MAADFLQGSFSNTEIYFRAFCISVISNEHHSKCSSSIFPTIADKYPLMIVINVTINVFSSNNYVPHKLKIY
jgi:hypothetical protein